jgi:sugar/nucleoside kinase (ribokinase family)
MKEKKVVEEEGSGDEDGETEEFDWPPLVCCFGEAHYEFIPTVRPFDRQMDEDIYSSWKGLQWSPPEFARAPGTSPSNVAVALARLGGRVVFVGKVANDVFGNELLMTLNENRVQTRGITVAECYGTAVSQMRLTCGTGSGVQMTCESPSVESTLQLEDIDLDILKEARMFQFTSISLMYEPLRSTLMASIDTARKGGTEIFLDVNLPLTYWRSRETTWSTIEKAWKKASMIEVTKQELEFLLGEDIYEKKRARQSVYFSKSVEEMKQTTSGREEYHYMPEELAQVWHKNLRILFVTDGTWRIHYYTPFFHGSVAGTEDVLVTPFSCDRTGSGDAVIAAIIRKLTTQPQLLLDQEKLEKALRFAICAGIVSQWTVGAVRGFPTESAAQNLTEQVYPPSMVLYTI